MKIEFPLLRGALARSLFLLFGALLAGAGPASAGILWVDAEDREYSPGDPFPVAVTVFAYGTTGGTVSVTSSDPATATVTDLGNGEFQVDFLSLGTVDLTATETPSGDTDVRSVGLKLPNSIEYEPPVDQLVVGTGTDLSAGTLDSEQDTGTSPVFARTAGPGSLAGTVLTADGAGNITVEVTLPGNDLVLDATTTATIEAVQPSETQTIAFDPPGAVGFFGAGDPRNETTVAATASSGLEVSLVSSNPGVLSVSGPSGGVFTLTAQGVGTATLTASQAGNSRFLPAPEISAEVDVLAGQTITFPPQGPFTFSEGLTVELAATSDSGLPVSYSVVSGDAGSIAGNVLQVDGAGAITLRASQEGNETFAPAEPVNRTILIERASQQISFFGELATDNPGDILDRTIGDPDFEVAAVATSGQEVTISVGTVLPPARGPFPVEPVTVEGNTVSVSSDPTQSGVVTLVATQPGTGGYEPATATRTFTVRRSQEVSVAPISGVALGDPAIDVQVLADPSEGQEVSVEVLDGPAAPLFPGSLELTIFGVGPVSLFASAAQTDYDPTDPEANLYAAASTTASFVVGGTRPEAGPGFLDLWTWRNPESSPDEFYNDVEANPDRSDVIAVGEDGRIARSTDGSAWSLETSGTTEDLNGVAIGTARYVAVGEESTALVSTDGISWGTAGVSGIAAGVELTDVHFDPDAAQPFAAVGRGAGGVSVLYTSADGLAWTPDPTFPGYLQRPNALAHSDAAGAWIVAGDGGAVVTGNPAAWTVRVSGLAVDFNGVHVASGAAYVVGEAGTVRRSDGANLAAWEEKFSGTDYELHAIFSGNGFLVAVGEDGRILRSREGDGNLWTESVSRFPLDLRGLGYFEGLFVGVGQNFTAMSSGSGLDWTQRSSSQPTVMNGVAGDGSTVVAVGEGGRILRSTDGGSSWSPVSSGVSSDLEGVIWDGARFLAVGEGGTILRSTDGAAWGSAGISVDTTAFGGGPFSARLTDLVYDGSAYVAVGEDFSILRSTDGSGWTRITGGSARLEAVAASGTGFVAVGEFGGVWSSPDGGSWSGRFSGTVRDLEGVTYGDGLYVAVGDEGVVMTSPTGETWESRVSSVTSDLRDVLFHEGMYFAVGERFAFVVSDDGAEWESQVSGSQNVLEAVAVAGDRFVAAGDFDSILTAGAVFPTGLDSWTLRNPVPDANDINDVAFGNDGFVAVGDDGQLLLSTDGRNWEEREVLESTGDPLTEDLLGVDFGNGRYLAVGGQKLVSSEDGRNWTVVTTWTVPVNGVTFADGRFVVTGDASHVFYSTDGLEWFGGAQNGIHAPAPLRDVAYDPGSQLWVAVGDSSEFTIAPDETEDMTQLFLSPDGIAWSRVLAPETTGDEFFDGNMRAVSFGNGTFRAFGEGRLAYDVATELWRVVSTGGFTVNASLFTQGNGRPGFVAVGVGGAIAGTDPGFISFPGVTQDLNGIDFGAETYVAVGNGGRILSSVQAREWNIRTTANLAELNDVTVDSLGRYVAVGAGATILGSEDSIAWTPASNVPVSVEGRELFAVASLRNGFLAAGEFGTLLESADGAVWERVDSGVLADLNDVAVGPDRIVAVGGEGTVVASENGTNWIEVESGTGAELRAVSYADGLFLAVGEEGTVLSSPDGTSWSPTAPTGFGRTFFAVGYGELSGTGQWVVAGQGGALFATTDGGASWTERFSGTTNALRDIAFGSGNFLSVGFDGTAITSGNGSEWFGRSLGTDYRLNGAAFFNGVFTAVGDFQTIVTSGQIQRRIDQEILFEPVGAKVIADPDFALEAVATSGLPVAFEIVEGPAGLSGDVVSLDGTTGTVVVRATQPGNVRFNPALPVEESFEVRTAAQTIDFFGEPGSPAPGSIADRNFGDADFTVEADVTSSLEPVVTVASGPAVIVSQGGGVATVSLSGAGTVTLAANQGGNDTFVPAPEVTRTFEVGIGEQTIAFEPLGTAGAADPPVPLDASASSGLPVSFAVTSGPGEIVDGNRLQINGSGTIEVVATQPGNDDYEPAAPVSRSLTVTPAETGDEWRERAAGVDADLYGVAFAGSDFHAVGARLNVLSSPGGQSWTLRANGGGLLRDVAYGGVPAVYVAVGADGVPVSSTDGVEWTVRPETALPALNAVAYGAGRFVAVGAGGAIRRSLDGSVWTTVDAGASVDLEDVVYSGGRFVAVGGDAVLVSEDGGRNWQTRSFRSDEMILYGIAGDGADGYLAVGNGGRVFHSVDGGDGWNVRPSSIATDLRGVAFGDGRFVTVGDAGVLFTSDDDGRTWKARESGTLATLRHVAYRADVFVAVGDAGTILTSGLAAPETAQAIDFPAVSPPPPGGTTTTLTATALAGGAPSGRRVEFHLVEGTGTVSGTALQPDGSTTADLSIDGNPGPYRIRALLPGGGEFLPVAGVDREFVVAGETQELAGLSPAPGELGFSSAPIGLSAIAVDAVSGDPTGLPVEFEVVFGDATVGGSSLELGGGAVGGTVEVRAFNSGDETYSPLDETFVYEIVAAEAEIVFNAIPDKLLGDDDFFVEARTSTGEDVRMAIVDGNDLVSLRTFTENDGNGNQTVRHEVSIKGTDDAQGRVVLEAFPLAGSEVSAEPVRQSFYVSKFAQEISFVDPGGKTFGDPPFVVNASADGGGEVTLSLADETVASLDGSTVTILAAGTIKVIAEASPNGDFGPASGELTVPVAKADQRLEFEAIDDRFEGSPATLSLVARTFVAGRETPADPADFPVSYNLVEGGDIASVSGSTLSLTGDPGRVVVQASQPGNANVNAADPVERSFAVSNFGRASTGVSERLGGAAYGLGRYVAVGNTGAVARSVDGGAVTDWQALVPSPTAKSLADVAFGSGRFVAVGWDGTALASTDGGKTWTETNVGTPAVLGAVAFGDGRFVAIERATTGRIFHSADGLSWTAVDLPAGPRLSDVAAGKSPAGGTLFVAVGFAGTVFTSPDGTTWTRRSVGTQNLALESVTFGDGRFVAITPDGQYLFSSDGGRSWTRREIPPQVLGGDPALSAIAFGNSSFRVVGAAGTILRGPVDALAQPVDPATGESRWERGISVGEEDLVGVAFGGDRFVVTGNGGTVLVSLPETGPAAPLSLPGFGEVTPVAGTTTTFASPFLGRLSFEPGDGTKAYSGSLNAWVFAGPDGVSSDAFGRLDPTGFEGWVDSSALGRTHFGMDPAAYGGWVSTARFGWMRVETEPDGSTNAWVPRLETWIAVVSDGVFESPDFGRLEATEDIDRYRSPVFADVWLGDFGGWFYSSRFGWVWVARGTGGVWFWSDLRAEWLGITPGNGLWSTAENRFL